MVIVSIITQHRPASHGCLMDVGCCVRGRCGVRHHILLSLPCLVVDRAAVLRLRRLVAGGIAADVSRVCCRHGWGVHSVVALLLAGIMAQSTESLMVMRTMGRTDGGRYMQLHSLGDPPGARVPFAIPCVLPHPLSTRGMPAAMLRGPLPPTRSTLASGSAHRAQYQGQPEAKLRAHISRKQ